MSTIKQTIADLFELDKMAPEKAAEMAERLGKLVFQAVLVRVLPILSEQDLVEYEKIVDSKEGGEVIFKFLGEKVPDFENIIMEEAESLRAELAGEFKEVGI
ncbi:MAG: DUF5663 domain-containing protein [Minisyncoccia bacterium]